VDYAHLTPFDRQIGHYIFENYSNTREQSKGKQFEQNLICRNSTLAGDLEAAYSDVYEGRIWFFGGKNGDCEQA
jgi:hypothetical protein